MKSQYKRLAIIPLLVIALLCVPTPASAALPAGFELETIAGGITLPTGMAFAPDGRIFVAGKAGAVHVIKNGVLLPTPLIQLTDVNTYGDRGLIGIAVDPNFSVNHFLYLSYTFENTPGANFSGRKTGRIVRVTVEGDTASESSKFILVGRVGGNSVTPSCDNYAIGTDCIPSDSSSHSVGGLRFGPDGKLYATLGDGSDFDRVDARSERAQNLDSLAGKMLRINTDGSAPADNPYYTTSTANRSKVYAYGFRNMFRFNFRPSTGALYGGDVGWDTWEEVNKITRGGNYGWPCREGDNPAFGQTCTAPGAINPFYSYIHDPQAGGAVVSGAFPGVGAYPAAYNNTMFFGDFALNFIKTLNASTTDTFVGVTDFMDGADGADGPVEFLTGPDGRVYLISIYTGDVRRINYTLGNRLPQASIAATPTSGLAPLNVSFSSAGSSDPDGNPLSYLWNFGDNTTSALANPSHTYTANGTYTAILTVFDGQGGQQTKNVTVNVGNRAPTPTIISPSNGEFYLVGEVLNVSGSATDPENGNLTGSALTWRVILHHNTHSHVLETRIGATFQITGPDHTDPNVYLELELTATDTGGVSAKTSINLYVNNTVSADGNWVRNRSFESADPIKPTLPEFWISNKWGTNTAIFTYPVAGDGSAKAVKIDMSGFTDGDAKWSHDPAQVKGGMTFDFSDSYMSTAPSRITAQYGFIDGTVTFEDLAYLPASAVWNKSAVTLKTPANAKTLVVYHLIEANGSLTVDNFSLTIPTPPATTTPPVAGNLIGNPSLETAAGAVPAGWSSNKWGTNTTVFSYPVAGQDGAKAAKMVVSGYASGDAKWYFDDIAVTAGTTYTFSDYYQSTAPSFLVARFKSSAGVYTYGEIATAPTSAGWSQISKPIVVPANTVALTVFHLLRSNGSLTVDTFALTAPGASTTTPPGTNLIINGFMETGTSITTVQGWTPTSVGGITTAFNYPTTGVDTGKAASIQITNYPSGADGNARWQFDEVPVQTGVEYTYESFYKGSTISDIIGRYTFNDNTEHYFGLKKEIPAAVNWTPVTGKFVGPVNVKSVTLMHQIGTIATLSIDNSKMYVSGTGTPAEIIPPVVNFTSPLTGDTVSGIVTLNANATDNVGIAGVFFAVDGTPISAETATAPYTFQWDSRTVADGTHALKVTARDASGNNNREIITVTVNNSATTPSNLVLNPSLETANGAGTAPLNWASNKWGTNTTTFTYPVAGQDGAKGARVAVTAWTSGDAKWYFDDVAVTPGTQYTFKDYYLANVTTDVVVRYKNSAGVFSYVYLATLPANIAFTQSNIIFTPPSGIVSATVFHLIAKVGTLTIDNVSVAPTNTPASTKPTITSFTANPVTINQGSSSTLSWVIANASSTSINQGIGSVTGSSVNVTPSATTTYTITATNPAGSATSSVTVGVKPTVVVPGGSLVVSLDSSSPSYKLVSANSTDVTISAFKFRPTNDSVTLKRIGLKLTNTASSSASDLVIVKLYVGATQIGQATFTGANVNATSTAVGGSGDMSYVLPKDVDTVVTVKADIAAIGTNQPAVSGHLIAIDVDTNGTNTQGTGNGSGSTITASGSTASAGVRIFKSVPTFTYSTSAGSLVNGVNELLLLSITADSRGEIQLNKLTFKIATTSVTVTNPTFIGPNGNVASSSNIKINSAGNTITVYFDSVSNTSDRVVAAGSTKVYTLRGTVSGLGAAGGSVATALKGDTSFPSFGASIFMGKATDLGASNIVWSPSSTTTAVVADNDWTNGYGLGGCFTITGLGNDCNSRILSAAGAPPPAPANLILNPSLETGGATPANWSQDFWGTNTRVFTYPVAGQSGAKAAKVTITAFTDGDAKWAWDDVVVTAGKTYLFSDYYQSDVVTSIVIQYTMTNGTYQYVDKGTTVASAAWKQYQTTITPPSGVKSFTVFHLLDRVGSLTVDTASLTVQ